MSAPAEPYQRGAGGGSPLSRAESIVTSFQSNMDISYHDGDDQSFNNSAQSRATRRFSAALGRFFRGTRRRAKLLTNGTTSQRMYRFMRRPLKRGVREKAKIYMKKLYTMTLSEFLYAVLFRVLSVIFIGLIVCTMVDMIPQSVSSGQYWNSIIIILTCAIILAIAIILYIVRALDTKRSISRIPRAYLVQELGVPKRSLKAISDESERCARIFKTQVDGEAVHHPGLANPKSVPNSNDNFAETVEAMPLFLEFKVRSVDPRFSRSVGCDLRSYLRLVVAHHIIDEANAEFVEVFIELFEKARFSGKLLTEEQYKELMYSMCTVMVAISRNSQKYGSASPPPPASIRRWETRQAPLNMSEMETFSDVGSVIVYSKDEEGST